MEQILYTLDTMDTLVDSLVGLMPECSVFTFTGPLGAGKTTLIKRILAHCRVHETVVSPTFTLVARYENDCGQVFYHFDLYRLKSLSEFRENGFDEYLYTPQSWAFIEWPEIIKPLLIHRWCDLTIEYVSEHERIMGIDVHK